jgi:hypothetical protein
MVEVDFGEGASKYGRRIHQMKGYQQYSSYIEAATTGQRLPVIQAPKDRILRRIRRSSHARVIQAPTIAEIVVRIAAALILISVCAQAISR